MDLVVWLIIDVLMLLGKFGFVVDDVLFVLFDVFVDICLIFGFKGW